MFILQVLFLELTWKCENHLSAETGLPLPDPGTQRDPLRSLLANRRTLRGSHRHPAAWLERRVNAALPSLGIDGRVEVHDDVRT